MDNSENKQTKKKQTMIFNFLTWENTDSYATGYVERLTFIQ